MTNCTDRKVLAAFRFLFLLPVTLFIFGANQAHSATVVKEFSDVVTDPLKLGRASRDISDTVDRTLAELRDLERQGNFDATQRLVQIKGIVQDVIDAVDRNVANLDATIAKSLKAIQDIEQKTYKDAVNLIFRAQCLAEVAGTDILQRSVAELISNIIKSDPTVKILGIRVVDVSLTKIEITDPDLAYLSTKQHYLKLLMDIKESDHAFLILSRYQNIGRFASFALCHYIDQGLAIRFIEEKNEFERLSAPWLNVVRPTL